MENKKDLYDKLVMDNSVKYVCVTEGLVNITALVDLAQKYIEDLDKEVKEIGDILYDNKYIVKLDKFQNTVIDWVNYMDTRMIPLIDLAKKSKKKHSTVISLYEKNMSEDLLISLLDGLADVNEQFKELKIKLQNSTNDITVYIEKFKRLLMALEEIKADSQK